MSIQKRDRIRLEKIVEYCDDIMGLNDMPMHYPSSLREQQHYQKVIAFDILQIGELVASLTEIFKNEHPSIPWRKIKSTRNRIVHQYGTVNQDLILTIVAEDIPELKRFCQSVLDTEVEM